MRASRGTLTEPGQDSPHRARSADENLDLFRRMEAGEFADGRPRAARERSTWLRPTSTCATRPSTASATPTHHRTGDTWCVYPMYTFAHPIEDALERITHSICTLEFEDQRPFYDWLLERLAEGGLLARPLPQQIEFARLNLSYVVLSKRKLIQLVEEKHVDGWDDPRLPTLVGARRRGYTPKASACSPSASASPRPTRGSTTACSKNACASTSTKSRPRRIAVLDPVKLVIDNYPEGQEELPARRPTTRRSRNWASAPCPSRASCGSSARITEATAEGLLPPVPRQQARLRYGFVVKCIGCRQGCRGQHHRRALRIPARQQIRHAGRRRLQGQGQYPLGQRPARLPPPKCGSTTACSPSPNPGAGGRDFLADLNPNAPHHRGATGAGAGQGPPGRALPVRAPRLFRRRPGRQRPGQTGVQPGGDAEGFVGQGKIALPTHPYKPQGGAPMEFLHVGMKVNDIQRSVELYRTMFGMDWEPVKEYALTDITLHGVKTPCTTLVTHGKTANGFEVEMIQVVSGRTADNLVVGDGEGLTHFAFTVDDIDAAIADAAGRGLKVVCEFRSPYVDFVFIEGEQLGGPLTQLVKMNQPRQTYFDKN
jgi:catechol 2,3-dioxygenase-like lactoylglutathione lyase family enzyme